METRSSPGVMMDLHKIRIMNRLKNKNKYLQQHSPNSTFSIGRVCFSPRSLIDDGSSESLDGKAKVSS